MIFKVSEEEKKIRDEIRELRKEMAGISAVDEFARWVRAQRKMNKLEDQMLNYGQSRMDGRESIRWKATKAIQVINVCILFTTLKRSITKLTMFHNTGRSACLFGHH